MKKYGAKLKDEVNDLVREVRTDLKKLMRKKVNTQIIVDVHARDVVDKFIRDRYKATRMTEPPGSVPALYTTPSALPFSL